jgi:FtsZ-binding cell division protein ZapB
MKAVSNRVKPKIRDRISASEARVIPLSEWIRQLSGLAVSKTVVDENLAAAVAASQAQTSAISQCVTEIIAGLAVQAEELRSANTKMENLEGQTATAVEVAAVAQREAGETKSQLEMMTKEAARAFAENDEIKRLADDLKAALSSAGASAQVLFAKMDLDRLERPILSAPRKDMPISEPERRDRLPISKVDFVAAVTAQFQNEIQVHGDRTEVIAMTTKESKLWCDHGDTRVSCQDCISQDKPKPREEVERLKHQWDGDWEIEHTEGFGAHYAELLAFSIEMKAFWAERQAAAEAHAKKRLEEYAAEVGTPGNTALAQVLNRLAAEIKALERENCELVDRMNYVEAGLDRLK